MRTPTASGSSLTRRFRPACQAGCSGRPAVSWPHGPGLRAGRSEPASTHTLARRHELAPSTVYEHLAVLHQARLVTRRRHRHTVLYQQTLLGAELADAVSY